EAVAGELPQVVARGARRLPELLGEGARRGGPVGDRVEDRDAQRVRERLERVGAHGLRVVPLGGVVVRHASNTTHAKTSLQQVLCTQAQAPRTTGGVRTADGAPTSKHRARGAEPRITPGATGASHSI